LQLEKIRVMDNHLRNRHNAIEAKMDADQYDSVRRRRMIYRSKQRGWLEADLLMGSWAVNNIPTLTETELDEYEQLLQVETIDIYNYISGKDSLPEHLSNLSVLKKLQGYALTGNMNSPEGYKNVKKETNLT
jgi:succinate dehydrogenase assembly factor 2